MTSTKLFFVSFMLIMNKFLSLLCCLYFLSMYLFPIRDSLWKLISVPGYTANQMSKSHFFHQVKSSCPIYLNDLMKGKKGMKEICCRVALWYLLKKDFMSYWDTIRKLVMPLVCIKEITFYISKKPLPLMSFKYCFSGFLNIFLFIGSSRPHQNNILFMKPTFYIYMEIPRQGGFIWLWRTMSFDFFKFASAASQFLIHSLLFLKILFFPGLDYPELPAVVSNRYQLSRGWLLIFIE